MNFFAALWKEIIRPLKAIKRQNKVEDIKQTFTQLEEQTAFYNFLYTYNLLVLGLENEADAFIKVLSDRDLDVFSSLCKELNYKMDSAVDEVNDILTIQNHK